MRLTFLGPLALLLAAATASDAQSVTGQVQMVTIARGDTLWSMGARFGVDPATIARENNRTLDAPLVVGDVLKFDNRHIVPAFPANTTLLINVPQRTLFLETESRVAAFPVAVGRSGWQTPLGDFTIISREVNPTWDVPESIREEARRAGRSLPRKVPPGPGNPLGAYWLGLSIGAIGIHGTNAPSSVYHVVTHGCIRLHATDIATVFARVQIGTPGRFVYEPILVAVQGDEVFVEAHRDVYGRGPKDALEFVKARAYELGVFDRVDWDAAGKAIRERAGVARRVVR